MLSSNTRRLAIILTLSAAWLALWCAPALAHAGIVQRQPDDGAALSQAPRQVKLTFNEPVEAAFDPLKVYAAGGERVDRKNARTVPGEPEAVVVDLEELPRGTYTVEYRITSVDGHVIDGDYEFRVTSGSGQGAQDNAGEPRQPENPEEAERSSPEDTGDSTVYIALGIGVLAILAVGGAMALRRQNIK